MRVPIVLDGKRFPSSLADLELHRRLVVLVGGEKGRQAISVVERERELEDLPSRALKESSVACSAMLFRRLLIAVQFSMIDGERSGVVKSAKQNCTRQS